MKKILIITYYWPPAGGAGVQRWLKFVKYLPQFGWQPIVFTPSNGEAPVIDNSLLKDIPNEAIIIKTPIWEPYSLYKKFIGQKKEEKINAGFLSESNKPSLLQKISVWIRGNLFIPDARKFWIKPSVKFLTNYLKENQIDAIVSTGPPHSMHLIALSLKEKFRHILWIVDFRDPWTSIDFYDQLMLTKWADAKHHQLEVDVLKNADRVIGISETMTSELQSILYKNNIQGQVSKFSTITNGYDEDDVNKGEIVMDKKFTVAHIGTLVKSRNPIVLWKVLSEMINKDVEFASNFQIKLVGKVDIEVIQTIERYGLQEYVKKIEYLPHDEVIVEQQRSQVLLLIINDTKNAKGILTGKFFEYLAAKRPILCIGKKDGDAGKILEETKAGKISDFMEEQLLKKNILEYYNLFAEKNLKSENKSIERYSRKNLTEQLSRILNN